jgi:hypothetical protein
MDGHPPPGIQIQAMPHKVGNVTFTFNVSLFLFYCWSVIFFPFCLAVFLRQIPLHPHTQDVKDRLSYSLLSDADVKSAVRCVTGQDGEHGARGSGFA